MQHMSGQIVAEIVAAFSLLSRCYVAVISLFFLLLPTLLFVEIAN